METESKAAKANSVKRVNGRRQRGYTLLEYCAGAAIIATVMGTALNAMGTNFTKFTTAINDWAGTKATALKSS